MLDDINVIKQRDPQGALAIAASSPDQLKHEFTVDFTPTKPVLNVVLTGMGGSAFPAGFVSTWPKLTVPFLISRDYVLPDFVGTETLVIVSSFSGNTEETLSSLEDARKKGTQIVIQANGGKLKAKAAQYNLPFVQIPDCAQPRMASFYFYKAIVAILGAAGLTDKNIGQQLTDLSSKMAETVKTWAANVPEKDNLAKQIAQHMVGKTPIIYSGPLMYPAAVKWKICVNENAKNTAWCNIVPEMCHNEFIGWSGLPVEKPFAVFDIVSSFEHERTKLRFEVVDKLLSGKRPKAFRIEAKGDTQLEQMVYAIMLGEHASVYLAILNNINPTPVDLVEKLKIALG
ncbi:MAG TPA: SIS domain-containing protein [Candidatus Saccharimonadales bacterium]|nr:SIS domain-containing protein [Candidatus Saccharimonadales bacterium]